MIDLARNRSDKEAIQDIIDEFLALIQKPLSCKIDMSRGQCWNMQRGMTVKAGLKLFDNQLQK